MAAEAEGERHLAADEVVAYVDGAVDGDERRRIEAHLAACAECRVEVSDVVALARALPAVRRARLRIWVPAAAAAGVAIVLAWPRHPQQRTPVGEAHRRGAVMTTAAPRPIAPAGVVTTADTLVWTSVPGADAYAVRVFDASSTVIWDGQTSDTTAVLPATIGWRAGASYFWKVEARTGFDRWAASELVEFVVPNGRRSR
jgi:anti-sigma factor RsiW